MWYYFRFLNSVRELVLTVALILACLPIASHNALAEESEAMQCMRLCYNTAQDDEFDRCLAQCPPASEKPAFPGRKPDERVERYADCFVRCENKFPDNSAQQTECVLDCE